MSSFIAIKYVSKILGDRQAYKKESANAMRFKRNFELFKILFDRNPKIEFENNYSGFFFGKKGAEIHISLLSNPFCGFCAEAHEIVEELLKKYPEQISVQMRFNYLENSPADLKKVISAIRKAYRVGMFKTILL